KFHGPNPVQGTALFCRVDKPASGCTLRTKQPARAVHTSMWAIRLSTILGCTLRSKGKTAGLIACHSSLVSRATLARRTFPTGPMLAPSISRNHSTGPILFWNAGEDAESEERESKGATTTTTTRK